MTAGLGCDAEASAGAKETFLQSLTIDGQAATHVALGIVACSPRERADAAARRSRSPLFLVLFQDGAIMHFARSNVLFGFLMAFAGASSAAHADKVRETAYLAGIEGQWSGSGSVRLAPGMPHMTVNCKLSGDAEAGRADLSGHCSGLMLSTSVNAKLRYSGKASSYSGSWSTGGNNAKLSGLRRGKGLSLAVSEAEEPARTLRISLSQGALVIVMTRVDDGAQVLKLALTKAYPRRALGEQRN